MSNSLEGPAIGPDRSLLGDRVGAAQALQSPGRRPANLRDRALLPIGFAGALRRSELVALNLEDLEHHPRGLLVHLRRSKTDQEGAGQRIALPARPGSRFRICRPPIGACRLG